MRILIVAATAFEVQPLSAYLAAFPATSVEIFIAGVGMSAFSFSLGRQLALESYDFLINVGIAGCFDKQIPLGSVFQVTQDCFSELGAEDDQQFISIDELGFGSSQFTAQLPPTWAQLCAGIPQAEALTVNTVHGQQASIEALLKRFPTAQLESMEGAAFLMAASLQNIPCLQIRAISNYVEKRNRATWNIPLAIKNANDCVISLLANLKSEQG